MPRIELVPNRLSAIMEGGTSPTVDLCADCANGYEEGQEAPDDLLDALASRGIKTDEAEVGSCDVEHPPYQQEDCTCASCGTTLGEGDN